MEKLYVFVLSLLVSIQLASAQTSETAAYSATQIVANASRTSGVAPLAVFFDATGTTNPSVTSRPFHDLEYRWNFGDTSAPMWTRGSRPNVSSKNAATGPLAAHVYENPGTYTATLTVFDGTNSVARQISITVQDPNTVFSGPKTVCFSTGARGFAGCPSGAQQVGTSDFATAINTYKGTGKRLLFRRGETFSSAGTASIAVDGPGIVGSFGAATDPQPVLQSTANVTEIKLSSSRTPNIRDWRLMDLNLLGSGGSQSYGVGMDGGINQVTLLRLTTQKQRIGIITDSNVLDWYNRTASTSGHRIWDQFSLVDSTVTAANHSMIVANKGYGTYISADRAFYAGNYVDNGGTAATDVAHVARFPYLGKSVISNNTLMRPGPGEHVIKLHAPTWGAAAAANRGLGGGYTRWLVISDNKIVGASNPWMIAIGPQNSTNDERVKDVISERNWLIAGSGMQVAEIIFASDVTSRSNIFDMSAGASWQTGIHVGRRGVEPAPSNIRVYNDTFYSSKYLSAARFMAVDLESSASSVSARNNVAYAPHAASPMMIRNACGGCLAQSNNSTSSQILFNLPFAVAAPTTPTQFKAAGYPIGAGTTIPAWLDFFLASIGTASRRDMGAVIH